MTRPSTASLSRKRTTRSLAQTAAACNRRVPPNSAARTSSSKIMVSFTRGFSLFAWAFETAAEKNDDISPCSLKRTPPKTSSWVFKTGISLQAEYTARVRINHPWPTTNNSVSNEHTVYHRQQVPSAQGAAYAGQTIGHRFAPQRRPSAQSRLLRKILSRVPNQWLRLSLSLEIQNCWLPQILGHFKEIMFKLGVHYSDV